MKIITRGKILASTVEGYNLYEDVFFNHKYYIANADDDIIKELYEIGININSERRLIINEFYEYIELIQGK